MRLDLTVIIVNWNTSELLSRCLASVFRNAGNVNFEVVVVDNGSVDGSCQMVEKDFPEVRLIKNHVNKGYAAALNQGMRIAVGRYMLLLNSDIIICEGSIGRTMAYASARPRAAVVGCQVVEEDGRVRMTCFDFPSVFSVFCEQSGLSRLFKNSRLFQRERMLWWKRDTERQVNVVSGMFMLVRSEAVRDVGLMDENYFLFFEETDWCRRFVRSGWELLFWPGAKVIHHHGGGQSGKKDARRVFVIYRKSQIRYFRKNHGILSALAVRVILLADALSRTTILSLLIVWGCLVGKPTAKVREKLACYSSLVMFCLFNRVPRSKYHFESNPLIRDSIEYAAAQFYWLYALIRPRRSRKVILYYHRVPDGDRENFRRQMRYLKKRNYTVVSPWVIRNSDRQFSGKVVALTFDDGFLSVRENVLPVLKELNFPAGVCVPTGSLGEYPDWEHEGSLDRERVVNGREIIELAENNFEILSHSASHRRLTGLDDGNLNLELRSSRGKLEEITGSPIRGVSYPYGAHDRRVRDAASCAGYEYGLAIEPRLVNCNSDDMALGRFAVSASDSLSKFRLKAAGCYVPGAYFRKLKSLLIKKPKSQRTHDYAEQKPSVTLSSRQS